jgi:hypothetical protein
VPSLRRLLEGHTVACHWAEEIRSGEIQPHERKPVFQSPLVAPVPGPPPT